MTTQQQPEHSLSASTRRTWPWVAATIAVLGIAGIVVAVILTTSATEPQNTAPTNADTVVPAAPATFDMTGSFVLSDSSGYGITDYGAGGCAGTGGYADITNGTEVAVYSADGTIIAVGTIDNARRDTSSTCAFDVSVPGVPTGERFYQVEIGHRGRVTMPESNASFVIMGLGDDPSTDTP